MEAARRVRLLEEDEAFVDADDSGGLRPAYHRGSDDEACEMLRTLGLGDETVEDSGESQTEEEGERAAETSLEPLSQFQQRLLAEVIQWYETSTRPFKVATICTDLDSSAGPHCPPVSTFGATGGAPLHSVPQGSPGLNLLSLPQPHRGGFRLERGRAQLVRRKG